MMGVLSLGASWPLTISQHRVAFQVKLEDVLKAPQELRLAGLAPLGAQREAIDEPIVFAWMPAASVFFDDPDGNLLDGAPSVVVDFSRSLREVGIPEACRKGFKPEAKHFQFSNRRPRAPPKQQPWLCSNSATRSR